MWFLYLAALRKALIKIGQKTVSTAFLIFLGSTPRKLAINTLRKKLLKHYVWTWVNISFNKVDEERLKEFGPDRTCAEWILRNGGAVRLCGYSDLLKDYNKLPPEGTTICIEEVDATNSSVMENGFEHFRGCKAIEKLILHHCDYLENRALGKLGPLKESLLHLQVSSCHNVKDTGVMRLDELKRLKKLILFDLPLVENKNAVLSYLKSVLDKCDVEFK